MPSKNMIRKGKRRQTVKHDYRVHRDAVRDAAAAEQARLEATLYGLEESSSATGIVEDASEWLHHPEETHSPKPAVQILPGQDGLRHLTVAEDIKEVRLDAYLAQALPEISRARAQLLVTNGQVRVDGKAAKASLKLVGGEHVEIAGEPQPPPLRAVPEDIPLTVVYEDADLAAIDKPAGMTVHAGAGDAEHNRGTLVNALLFRFQKGLSAEGGELRPGIVHRLDKETSGLILVAKNDTTHRKLAGMFQSHALRKVYLALVHGTVLEDEGTLDLPIGRDPVRRMRMTARRSLAEGARPAVSHWRVLERIGTSGNPGPWGAFTLLEVEIETGRTHQIRVHLASMRHPVVGDTLYGAPALLRGSQAGLPEAQARPTLPRNFLHAAELDLEHPRTGQDLRLRSQLPEQLTTFLDEIRPTPGEATTRRPTASRVAKIKGE